jgi:Domain of unknown function (DUF4386)
MSPGTLIDIRELDSHVSAPPGSSPDSRERPWSLLYRIASVAAFVVVALIPIQALIFILWPPPATVLGYFTVFQNNFIQGLLDLDLLLLLDQLLIIVVLLGLYLALRNADQSLMLLAVTIGMIGALLFIISREATFSMMWLSQQYSGSTSDAERAALQAAGQTLLTVYNGTAFSVGYFLSSVAMLLISIVMLRSDVFSRATGVAGVLAGVFGLVPASFGTLGFALSFISLLPLLVWLFLIGRRLLQLANGARYGPLTTP